MPASMKDIKLRIKSVQGTMQITKSHGTGGLQQTAPRPSAGGAQPPLF